MTTPKGDRQRDTGPGPAAPDEDAAARPHLDLADNRFERAYQRLRGRLSSVRRNLRRYLIIAVAALVVADLAAMVPVHVHYASGGIPAEFILHNHWLGWVLARIIGTPIRDRLEAESGKAAQPFNRFAILTESDPILGWRHRPNVMSFAMARTGPPLAFAATNGQGFVLNNPGDPDYAVPKPEGVFRIVMLGGSTVEGMASVGYESLPAQLERLLRAETPGSRSRIEVINAGMGGFDTSREYMYLVTEIVRYQPDLVIFYDGWNDYITNRFIVSLRERAIPSDYRIDRHYRFARAIEAQQNPLAAVLAVFSSVGLYLKYSLLPRTGLGQAYDLFTTTWWKETVLAAKKMVLDAPGLGDWVRKKGLYKPVPHDPDRRETALYISNLRRAMALGKVEGFRVAAFLQPLMGVDGKPYASGFEETLAKTWHRQVDFESRRLFYDKAREGLEALASEPVAGGGVHRGRESGLRGGDRDRVRGHGAPQSGWKFLRVPGDRNETEGVPVAPGKLSRRGSIGRALGADAGPVERRFREVVSQFALMLRQAHASTP